jgi:hypothetical protein
MVRKSQAAVEFLMSYGWVFLVVMIIFVGVSHFGILKPRVIQGPFCRAEAGLDCIGGAVVADGGQGSISIVIVNNRGYNIAINDSSVSGFLISSNECGAGASANISVDADSSPSGVACSSDTVTIHGCEVIQGGKARINVKCPSFNSKTGKYQAELAIPYKNSMSGLEHQVPVKVTGTI